MKRWFFIIICVCLFFAGCSPHIVPVQTKATDTVRVTVHEKIRDTIIRIEPDSSIVKALIECDSSNRAHITDMRMTRSKHITTDVTIADNTLSVRSVTDSLRIYLALRDRYEKSESVSRTEQINIVEVNRLYRWQKALMYCGVAMLLTIICITIKKILKWTK